MISFPSLWLNATREPHTTQIKAPFCETLWISALSQKPISRKRSQTDDSPFKPRTRKRTPIFASQRSTREGSFLPSFRFTSRNQH